MDSEFIEKDRQTAFKHKKRGSAAQNKRNAKIFQDTNTQQKKY